METELLLYFTCRSNASHEASITAAVCYTYTRDISVTYLLSCKMLSLTFKASVPLRQ